MVTNDDSMIKQTSLTYEILLVVLMTAAAKIIKLLELRRELWLRTQRNIQRHSKGTHSPQQSILSLETQISAPL